MGAGCYYKHDYPFDGNLAVWIEMDEVDQYSSLFEEIAEIIKNCGYNRNNDYFYNKLYKIELKSTYYGEGLIVYFKNQSDQYINLAIKNFKYAENKVLKALHKAGFKLRVATGGYTAKEYIPE